VKVTNRLPLGGPEDTVEGSATAVKELGRLTRLSLGKPAAANSLQADEIFHQPPWAQQRSFA